MLYLTYGLLLDINARGWLVSRCQIFIGIFKQVLRFVSCELLIQEGRYGVVESVLDMGSSQIGNALRSGYMYRDHWSIAAACLIPKRM